MARYSLGFNDFNYTDTTIYNKKTEARVDHQLSRSYSATQPWGSASLGVSGSNYLSDFSQYRASVFGGISVRIARGLQASWNLAYSRVHDQITLPKAEVSEEERLFRLRQLSTSYTYFGLFSLSYTFGSLFNNVVNPRIGGGGACRCRSSSEVTVSRPVSRRSMPSSPLRLPGTPCLCSG